MLVLKTKKACVFIRSMNGGGAQRVMVKYANGLHDAGVDVTVLTLSKDGPFYRELNPKISVIAIPVKKLIWSVPFLIATIRKITPNVVFCTEPASNVILCFVKLFLPKSIRLVIREGLFPSVARKESRYFQTRLAYSLAPYLYPIADQIVAIATELYLDLIENFGLPASKVCCIPVNPVVADNMNSLMLQSVDHDWLRNSTRKYIVGVGRLEHQKDFSTLIKAFSHVRKTEDLGLIIVGEGSEREMLTQLVRELDLDEFVEFVGFQSNPYPYMYRAETLVLSSVYEGLPNTLIEAIACGIYPVSTDCPSGPKDILKEGKYGRLVPVGDELEMARAIKDVVLSGYDRDSQIRYSKNYTLEKSIKLYMPKLFIGS